MKDTGLSSIQSQGTSFGCIFLFFLWLDQEDMKRMYFLLSCKRRSIEAVSRQPTMQYVRDPRLKHPLHSSSLGQKGRFLLTPLHRAKGFYTFPPNFFPKCKSVTWFLSPGWRDPPHASPPLLPSHFGPSYFLAGAMERHVPF